MISGVQTENALAVGVERAVRAGAEALIRLQSSEGCWRAEVNGGTRPASEFVLLQAWRGGGSETQRALVDKAIRSILAQQNADGGFAAYPGGPSDVDVSVLAYTAAKLGAGDDASLARARKWILSAGGMKSSSGDVQTVLALFGWCARPAAPAIPALAILRSTGVVRPSPDGFTLSELGVSDGSPGSAGSFTDRISWLRNRAVRRAGQEFVAVISRGDGLGTVNPYAYTIMALDALGSEPAKSRLEREYAALIVDTGSRFAVQPFDPTAHNTRLAVEALSESGFGAEAVARGRAWLGASIAEPEPAEVESLIAAQEQDGSWSGREGVNFLHGTFRALRAFDAAGESDREAHVLRGGEWLRSIQNADGGWGESCESYNKKTFAPGASTPSQTAWAVLGLIAGGDTNSQSVLRGVEYLAGTQQPDGSWREDAATGTGVPGKLYLRYDLYRQAYPLLALSTYLRSRKDEEQ